MTSRTKKAGYTAAAVLGLFIGAAGIAAASTGGTDGPSPAPATQTDEADDDGVNCEDGIDTATGNECDGGPAAAAAEEADEAPDSEDEAEEAESGDEVDDGVDHQFEGDEVGENGDGIPDADDASEDDATVNGFGPAQQDNGTAEADEADDDGVNCEDGIDTATGNECDGGPAAAAAEEADEAPDSEDEAEEAESGDEVDDGVDHQFEGEEVGGNGDGIPDADDASEEDD